jgi:hypothetical protein
MRGDPLDNGPDLWSLAPIAVILVLVLLALIDVDPRIAALFHLVR